MTNHWHALCKARDIVRTKNSLRVTIAGPHAADDARTHTVEVEEVPDGIQLRALVTRLRGDLPIGDIALNAWTRNLSSSLCGFRIDARNHLVAEFWLPTMGLTAEEFLFAIRSVAREADRFEFELTGADRH